MVVQQPRLPTITLSTFISIGLLLLCLLLPTTLLAKVSASVDRNMLYLGDSTILTIEAENQEGTPDFSPLDKNFRVGNTSQSQQISIVNGSYSNKTSWRIEIQPLTAKDAIIPPIQVGSEQTQPILLNIKQPTAQEQAQTANDIFIQVKADSGNQRPFVQQQIRYSVLLFFRLPLLEGELSDPAVEDAIIEQLGDAKRSHTIHNGVEYQVIERHYAIFPEKSGQLTIPPIIFQGRVSSNTPRQRRPQSARDRFFQDNFFSPRHSAQSSRPVHIQSEAITLQIQPQPAGYSGQHWLPSEQLALKDSWAKSPPEFRAGQPISRTITIEAKGLAASHIPQLALDAPSHLRIYPEPAETNSVTDGTWVFGQSEQKFTYIPSQSGRQSLPAITLTWWNLTTGQQEVSTLPAWQIDVLPPLEGTAHQSTIENLEAPTKKEEETKSLEQPDESEINWGYLSLFVGITLLLLLSAYYYRLKQKEITRWILPNRERENRETAILNNLASACSDNNPAAARKALLQLAAERWPQRTTIGLGVLAQQLSEGAAELQALDKALYATDRLNWCGADLWQIFKRGLPIKKPPSEKRDDGLESLYPH